MIIVVSGTPGTGKTLFAKKLANKKKLFYIDANKIIRDEKLFDYYDNKQKTYVVDIKKFNKKFIQIINSFNKNKDNKKKFTGLIIDSHLSHYLPNKYVDICYITRCSIKTLMQRLKKRKYAKKKIFDNIQAEIFEICLQEAIERGHRVKVIDTQKH
ncbi:MAG: AAA family ATPase [Candidatus Woesearchaeota archaeon]